MLLLPGVTLVITLYVMEVGFSCPSLRAPLLPSSSHRGAPAQVSGRVIVLSRARSCASGWGFEMHWAQAAGFVLALSDRWSKY